MQQALIDLEHLDRYVAGDRSLRDEILAIFEEQAEMWTKQLDPSAEDQAWRDAAHALKGASRGVGAWEVGHICQEAERLIGDARDEAARQAKLDALRAKVRSTIDEVRRLRDL
jgi:HPt (histidine-containing phosphotransfer) domain-containing protein